MKLKELAQQYGKTINEDSCPIHVFNELDKSEINIIDTKYKIGEKLIPYCNRDNCWECWKIEL